MDHTKKDSSEENPEETFSSAGLDRAFLLSSNDSFLLNDADHSNTRTYESLLGDDTGRYTSYLASDIKGPTVSPQTYLSDCHDGSCSRVNNEEPNTLSKLLHHMIQTVLVRGSKESKTREKVAVSDLSADRDADNNICHSPREEPTDLIPHSLGTAASLHLVNDGEDFPNIDSSSKLITIVEGTDESASNFSNGNSPNWSRMYLGKLKSFPPVENLPYDARTCGTSVNDDPKQNKLDINGVASSDVNTSSQSFGTSDNYFDTIDSDIHQNLEECSSEYYGSASELSSTEERFGEIANDTTDNYSEGSIASKISNSFGLVKNESPQTSLTSSGLKWTVQQGNKEEMMRKPSNKSVFTPVKRRTRFSRSSKDTAASSINVSPYDASGKDNTRTPCTPIRGSTKGYALQKAHQHHQFTESAKKNTPRNRISKTNNNSPRLSNWRSPVVVTSSIKPVKFLRNLFHAIEKKNRLDLGRPSAIREKKIAIPVIMVTPASPSYNQQ